MLAKSTAAKLVVAFVGAALASSVPDRYQLAFRDFIEKYSRVYQSQEEEQTRFTIFKTNYKFIEVENAKNQSYVLAVNEFADQAPEEFQATRLGLSRPPPGKLWEGLPLLGTDGYSGAKLPDTVDWTNQGAVTPPKNQQQCGSCWAFSSTGALEGAWQIVTGKLVSLSEQQLVDCSKENNGCKGGDMDMAFSYLKEHQACTEKSYPYSAKDGKCRESACTVGIPKGAITGYKDVPADDEQALMEAVAQQPVAIAIEADQMSFQMYSRGILTKTCGDKLDHGVLLVGYGTEDGMDYWKVKNSWGESWGEGGYVRLERGMPKAGECGVKSQPSYPVVQGNPGPAPGPSPGPSPSPPAPPAPPSPECADAHDFCKDPDIFDPRTDCELLAASCMRVCGCCGSSPPPYCSGPATAVNRTLPILVV